MDSSALLQSIASPTNPAMVFAWCGAPYLGTRAAALFALDHQLGDIIRTTTQPIVGQMRLTWWHEALQKLGQGAVPAHPILEAVAASGVPGGAPGASLAAMADGWELLLDEAVSDAALGDFARARGGTLFAALGGDARGGHGWALADLAAHVADTDLAARGAALARASLEDALSGRWRGDRVLGALAKDALLAMRDIGAAGSPRRAAAVLRMRLTGR